MTSLYGWFVRLRTRGSQRASFFFISFERGLGRIFQRTRTVGGVNENGGKWWGFEVWKVKITQTFEIFQANIQQELSCVDFFSAPTAIAAENEDSKGKYENTTNTTCVEPCTKLSAHPQLASWLFWQFASS